MPIRLGTQGWNYDAWVGPFYPIGTRAADYLALYARAFDTVEVDSTFYAVPSAKSVRDWAARVPARFTFALKLPKEISHDNRLRDAAGVAPLFFDCARELGAKLGPILIQLGPDFGPAERPALAAFLSQLPRDLQFAVEFRQRGWIEEGVLALLADHNVALALTDARWIPRRTMLALAEQPTADFAYVRWMGPNRDIVDYSRIQFDRTRELEAWAHVLRGLAARVRTVWGFANNHFAGHSPSTARDLQKLVGQEPVMPAALSEQRSLF
ncbi:MAG TPA: DUF72 domain-containing protein [Thermoanaerobaculia bacterium]|nr:DUF72 domain-containing protein [Thermoanaerobaculia bacterium]